MGGGEGEGIFLSSVRQRGRPTSENFAENGRKEITFAVSALRACFLKTFRLARDRYYAYVSTHCGILHRRRHVVGQKIFQEML